MRATKAQERPWAAYARISVDKDESVSIKGQRASVERWAKAYGHKLVWFTDEGVSGSKDVRRRERDDMERRLAEGEFAGVVVKAVDRLARNVRDFVRLAKVAEDAGGSVVVVEGGIDTGTDAGNMMMTLLSVFAEFEAKQIASRQRVSQEVRRQQGRSLGRPPYGFTNRHDEQGAWRIVHAEEAKAVKSMVKWVLAGDSLRQVAAKANEKGLPLREGKNAASQWTGEAVGTVLRNPSLNGQTPKGDDVLRGTDGRPVRDESLQILDTATWRDLQAALELRAEHRFNPATHEPLLLAGVAKCAHCGGGLSRSSANKGYPIYRCTNGGKGKCAAPVTITVSKLEGFIDDFVSMWEDVELPVITRKDDPALQAELADVTDNVERLLAAMASASSDEVARLAAQLTTLKAQQATLVQRIDSEQIEVAEPLGFNPAIAWQEGDEQARRALVPLFFSRIEVRKAQHNATPVEDRVVLYTPLPDGSGKGQMVWEPGATFVRDLPARARARAKV